MIEIKKKMKNKFLIYTYFIAFPLLVFLMSKGDIKNQNKHAFVFQFLMLIIIGIIYFSHESAKGRNPLFDHKIFYTHEIVEKMWNTKYHYAFTLMHIMFAFYFYLALLF